MYKKRKKVLANAIDNKLFSICYQLHKINEDTTFAISKKFVEYPDKSLKSEILGLPVIVCSKEINKLTIPSGYNLVGDNYLTTWSDSDLLVKLLYSELNFVDGNIKGKTIEGMYLDIDKDEEFKKSKCFVSF